ncbi:MAG: threonine--tRNA ligase [Candidatus Thermoplasmatota archaeon]|nr:threonine--tRNA ligase [Candidatus Thermoplasmatota archaeon]
MVRISVDEEDLGDCKPGMTILEILRKRYGGDLKGILGVKISSRVLSLRDEITDSSEITTLKITDPEGMTLVCDSLAHVLARAVSRIIPDATMASLSSGQNEFSYDFKTNPITEETMSQLQKIMIEILKDAQTPQIERLSKTDLLYMFRENAFKKTIIEGLDENSEDHVVWHLGDFADLCHGPHLLNLREIDSDAFELKSVSAVHWRGDRRNVQLQRISGVAFPSRKDLVLHQKECKELEKRDHRRIGKDLRLFMLEEDNPGMPFLLPNGMTIVNRLVEFWRDTHRNEGYQEISTPILLTKDLWLQSGHWHKYAENMLITALDEREYAIKPMNCPGAILVYQNIIHSYRDLPLRYSEIGLVHRHELSGVISGLFRVRAFRQDDAHIFLMESQIADELDKVIRLIDNTYRVFGFSYVVDVSTRPEQFIGNVETWERSTSILMEVLRKRNMAFRIKEKEGAFYGPKIDFHIRDCLGRYWQCGTIQLDFSMPERFNLEYLSSDGGSRRPVMIHRVVFGSIERFLGILIEHYGGKFPLWLCPIQIRVLPVTDSQLGYARTVADKLRNLGLVTEIDDSQNSISKKIRMAHKERIPYMVIIGSQEENESCISVRTLDNETYNQLSTDSFCESVICKIKTKTLGYQLVI